jgi:hypothetical protein
LDCSSYIEVILFVIFPISFPNPAMFEFIKSSSVGMIFEALFCAHINAGNCLCRRTKTGLSVKKTKSPSNLYTLGFPIFIRGVDYTITVNFLRALIDSRCELSLPLGLGLSLRIIEFFILLLYRRGW